ncbi:MAG: cytochrome P450 [Steroidobacteraceae bacterium]
MHYDELPKRDYDEATSQCPMRFRADCRLSTPLLRLTASNPEKNALLVTRADVRKHSTFGHGKHFCVGNVLGRTELRLTIEALLRRFASISNAVLQHDIEPFASFAFHALVSPPLRLVRIGESTEAAHG